MGSTLRDVELLNAEHLISTFGQLGIMLIIFLESFVAFFMPGDSLLFTAGLFAAQDKWGLNIWVLTFGTAIAAILGNQLGYALGRRTGPSLFNRPNARIFKAEYLEKTHQYFEHHGPKTIVLARFIPVVRTFACIVAGAGRMNYRLFLTYNVIGGVAWGAGVSLLGYALGSALPDNFSVDHYLLPIVGIVFLISVLPAVFEYYRARKHFNPKKTDAEVEELVDVQGQQN